MRKAVIDLGTNTFHLFIVDTGNDELKTVYREKIAVKLGQNGISKGRIAADAQKRALHALNCFKDIIDQFEVESVKGVATSAMRSAKNGKELVQQIKDQTGIHIDIISGDKEAELIFEGVKAGLDLKKETCLTVDIGGGSVEFIIGNKSEILWKRSFEIGAQRLLDQFHKQDPMPSKNIQDMFEWLGVELKELTDAIEVHKPTRLIGCSGTFDTLAKIYREANDVPTDLKKTSFLLPVKAYRDTHRELLIQDRDGRLAIPGMVTMRVDMIVVASVLISFILEHIQVTQITCCRYALKEGLLFSDEHKPISELSQEA